MKRFAILSLVILACSTVFGCVSLDKQAELSAKLDAEVVGQSKDAVYSFKPPYQGARFVDSYYPIYAWDCEKRGKEHVVCEWRTRIISNQFHHTAVSFWVPNGTVISYKYLDEFNEIR